jgi:transposase
VPSRAQRELRELTRYRSSLIHERTRVVQRLQKTLEGANVKLGSVATDILGKSGRDMLDALVGGTTDAKALADLAQGKLRSKLADLEQALTGRFGAHQRFLVAQQLAHIDFLDETITRLSAEVAERLRPVDEQIERLDGIPGVGRRTAEVLLAEIGTGMARFPSPGHLASWAGMCPGNEESAGKRLRSKTRKGNSWLRVALIEAAQAAARKRDSYLSAQFRRLTARRGRKKAAVAVGHSILVIVYWLLTRPDLYQYEAQQGKPQAHGDREEAERQLQNQADQHRPAGHNHGHQQLLGHETADVGLPVEHLQLSAQVSAQQPGHASQRVAKVLDERSEERVEGFPARDRQPRERPAASALGYPQVDVVFAQALGR